LFTPSYYLFSAFLTANGYCRCRNKTSLSEVYYIKDDTLAIIVNESVGLNTYLYLYNDTRLNTLRVYNVVVAECGDTLFNRDTHFCCDDVLHLVRDDRECCGGEVINTKYYNCIGFGRLFRYWKSLNPRYSEWTQYLLFNIHFIRS